MAVSCNMIDPKGRRCETNPAFHPLISTCDSLFAAVRERGDRHTPLYHRIDRMGKPCPPQKIWTAGGDSH